jgi:hypothetical protein
MSRHVSRHVKNEHGEWDEVELFEQGMESEQEPVTEEQIWYRVGATVDGMVAAQVTHLLETYGRPKAARAVGDGYGYARREVEGLF